MGTFAGIFTSHKSAIPESKKKEFTERIEKLLQAGGMMEIECVQLYGKKIPMLRKAKMTDKGMDFHFNYFEECSWENAGFNYENCYVWSGKIGWSYFHQAIVAAYVLEELYTVGIAVAMVDCDPVTSWGYVGWINYLFNEKYHIKNFDPWKLFEAYHYSDEKSCQYVERFDFGNTRYAFIGGCEIYAVLHGTKRAVEVYNAREKGEIENIAMAGIKCVITALKQYKEGSEIDEERQLRELMEAIHKYYETDEKKLDLVCINNENMKVVLEALTLCDAPAFAVKAISEIYNKDFWELWAEIENLVKRKSTALYGNDGYYVLPISTQKFFGLSPDDMILYWEENSDLEFSEELWEWFESLKSRYDAIVHTEYSIENPLKYIVNLMQEVDEDYYHIFTFAEFFEETLENLRDIRYQSLWKLYDEMIHDSDLKRAGDVIFVPDGPGHEKEGLHYWGEQPKRRLISNWDMINPDMKNNKARQTFRRYMALMANRTLRCKIFGF